MYYLAFVFLPCVAFAAIAQRDDVQPLNLQSGNHECPPWFFYNTSTENCECYHSPSTEQIVKCTDQGALLQIGYCMTHEEGEGTFVSLCQYFELEGHNKSETFPGFITLPDNVSELNDYMCGPMNRVGLVCSECAEGFALSFFSLRPTDTCVVCGDGELRRGIFLFLFLSYVPITIVYFICLIFEVGFTSAPFTTFLFFSQIAYSFLTPNVFQINTIINRISVTFYGFWNLNFFFTYFIPPNCIARNSNIIHVSLLRNVHIFYPFFLIFLTFVCIQLYSRDFKIFVCIWDRLTPLHKKLKRNSKCTLIDVFSTFLLLTFSKSVEILFLFYFQRTTLLNMNNLPTRDVFLEDPNIEYFGTSHILWVVISTFSFLVIFVPPVVILALYPIKSCRLLFQKCTFGGHRRSALNIFVERFYSCYRDGLDGGRDMRAFASLYFIVRFLTVFLSLVVVRQTTLGNYQLYSRTSIYMLLMWGTAVVIAIVRPYKKNYINIIDTLFLVDVALFFFMGLTYHIPLWKTFSYYVGTMAGLIPALGFIGFIVYKLIPFQRIVRLFKKKFPNTFCQKFYFCCTKSRSVKEDDATELRSDDVGSQELPDRVLNPEEYPAQFVQRVVEPQLPNNDPKRAEDDLHAHNTV